MNREKVSRISGLSNERENTSDEAIFVVFLVGEGGMIS